MSIINKVKSKFQVLPLPLKLSTFLLSVPLLFLTIQSYTINSISLDYVTSKYELQSLNEHCGNVNIFNVRTKIFQTGCLSNVSINKDYIEN